MEISNKLKKYFTDIDFTNFKLNENTDPKQLKKDDVFIGKICTTVKNPETKKKMRLNNLLSVYRVKDLYFENKVELNDYLGNSYKTSTKAIKILDYDRYKDKIVTILDDLDKKYDEYQKEKYLYQNKEKGFDFSDLEPEEKLRRTIEAGIKNIWMVGPAGCGKSTMARLAANALNLPYLCISCGIGTSVTEFIGYKYPTRESTNFAEYYAKPSIILIDEMTALDPCVAQILNAALANDEIETTTGIVHRNPNCIIIATSNTFGSGADRQYVANNQLDASTIDRFIGGIIEIDYSSSYENQFDKEVVEYVKFLRKVISENSLRRVASTRMIQAGHKLKYNFFNDWKKRLIINWSDTEKKLVEQANFKFDQNNEFNYTKMAA